MKDQTTEIDIDRFVHEQRRRDTWQFSLLGFFTVMFIASLLVAFVAARDTASTASDLLPALVLTLVSGSLIVRQWRMMLSTARHYRNMALPVPAAIEKMMSGASQRLREYRILLAVVIFGLLPVFMFAALQLFVQGKMTLENVVGFMGLVLVATLTVSVALRHRIHHQLKPQLKQLEELRRQFGGPIREQL